MVICTRDVVLSVEYSLIRAGESDVHCVGGMQGHTLNSMIIYLYTGCKHHKI